MLRTSDFCIGYWIAFSIYFCVLVFLDRVFVSKNSLEVKDNFKGVIFWCFSAALFLLILKFLSLEQIIAHDHSTDFLVGYLIELSLSVDNVFVFIMIFDKLKISQHTQNAILRIGIISAIILRFIMILFAIQLVQKFTAIFYVFGLILMMSAIHMLVSSIFVQYRYDMESTKEPFYAKYFVSCSSDKFLSKIDGKILPTVNFLALILVEKADILFAVDSIPAVIAVTKDSFIVFTSNILAVVFLRSLFCCLSYGTQNYPYLKHGMVLILFFIGIKLVLIPQHILIPKSFSIGFILVMLIGSILISKIKTSSNDKKIT